MYFEMKPNTKQRLLALLMAGAVSLLSWSSAYAQDQKSSALPLEQITTFSKIFETIKNIYVEDVDDEQLLRDATEGMIAGLDPHSALLTRTEMSQIEIDTRGEYGGLGLEVTKEANAIRVVSPIDDTPAHRAGIKAGDLIVRLDNQPVDRMNLQEAVEIMRGVPGSEIKLTIIRQGRENPLQVILTRAVIKIQSVRAYTLEPNYGYLRITQFQSTTPDLITTKVRELEAENDNLLEGVVLDLRNNPGGELRSAINVSDLFIDEGVIVSTKKRGGEVDSVFKAQNNNDILEGVPIVVLINNGSASASEIVSGALQDHKRAVLMGTRTFGKGSVQTIYQIDKKTALKLTTMRYYTPNDRSIQAEGVEPDIIVPDRDLGEEQEDDQFLIREADLSGALTNENGQEEEEPSSSTQSESHPALQFDFQLQQALNLLKGLKVSKAIIES